MQLKVKNTNAFEVLTELEEGELANKEPSFHLNTSPIVEKLLDEGIEPNEEHIFPNPPISVKLVVINTQPTSSSVYAEDHSEGDVENVYDETGAFMASGSGYGHARSY